MSTNFFMDVYYSHSMKIYDTEREKKEFEFLEEKYGKVLNPNGDIEWQGSMQPYIEAVKESDMVVLSEYANHIGHGVFDEALAALDDGKPVMVLRKVEDGFFLQKVKSVDIVDFDDWKVHYGEVII